MQTTTELYSSIKPFIQSQIDLAITAARSSLKGNSGGSSISGNYLLKTGDTITGPISVNAGVTIDGVDISQFATDTNTALTSLATPNYLVTALSSTLTNERLLAVSGLGLSTADGGAGGNYTVTLTSSSNPGAAAAILATTSAGLVGVQGIGIGAAGSASYAIYQTDGAKGSYLAGFLGVGTLPASTKTVYVADTFTNVSGGRTFDVQITTQATVDGTYYNHAFIFTPYIQVSSGVTNSGYFRAFEGSALRRDNADAGTLTTLQAMVFSYGHWQAAAVPETIRTTNAYGILLSPYAQVGAVTGAMYDLFINNVAKTASAGTPRYGAHYAVYQVDTVAANYFAGKTGFGVTLGLDSDSDATMNSRPMVEIRSTVDHLRLSYSATVYASHIIASTGTYTITTTHGTPSGAHLYLYPGSGAANVGIGSTSTPSAKLSITSTAEQLRLLYDTTNRASHTISSAGAYTISTTGTTPANAHLLLNPSGAIGINMTGTPGAELEVRSNSGAQQRWGYDATSYASLTVNSGGNATLTTYGSSIIADPQPVGGMAGLKFLRPANSYDVNLGQFPDKKWLSIYAAELIVENLIAFDTQATMGGRLLITPSTMLTENLSATGLISTIVHAGSSSAAVTVSSGTWTLTVPVGAQMGDLLIAVVTTQAASAITATGWTQVGTTQSWTGGRQLAVYRRFMAFGDVSYNITLGTSTAGAWAVSAYSGVNTSSTIEAVGFQTNTGTTSHVAPSVTPIASADMLLYVGAYNASSASMAAPASMTERVDTAYAAGFSTVYVASQLLSVGGATGTRTGTSSGSNDSVMGLIAIGPATNVPMDALQSKYNNLSVGDIIRMESNGKVEFMSVASGPTGSGPYSYDVTRNLDGTGANDWYSGDMAVNTGQAGAGWIDAYAWWSAKGAPFEFIYNYNGSTYSANQTSLTTWTLWRSSGVAANDAIYFGMGGGMWANINLYITANAYTTFDGICEYWNGSAWVAVVGGASTFYRDNNAAAATLSSSGELPTSGQLGTLVHSWVAASQTGWAKSVINGQSGYWVRWRVISVTGALNAVAGYRRVMRGAVQYGPTIEGVVRNSSTFNDWSTRWAIGNLHGKYDYGAVTYGFAAGNYATSWLSADATNGIRIMHGIATLGQWDTTGKIIIGTVANNESRVEISPAGRISIFNRQSAVDTERFYVSVAGDLGLYGNGSNYVTINGTTGVLTVSGVINVIAGSTVPVATVTGLGALATLNTVAWSSQVTGRPIDNNGLLTAAPTPAGNGLHLGSTLMGFYSGGQWRTYMDNSGNFLFRGAPSASVNVGGLWWNPSTGQLQGGYYAPAVGPAYGSYNVQWYTDAVSGAIYAGGGVVSIDTSGLTIKTTSSTYSAPSAYKFREQSTVIGYVWGGGANPSSGGAGQIVGTGLSALGSSYAAASLATTNLAGSDYGGSLSAIYEPAHATVNARARLDAYADQFMLSGQAYNSNLYLTTQWVGYADNTSPYSSEICNDVSVYKSLMIVGNKSAGGVRKVSMWDQLTINGTLVVTSTIGASGKVSSTTLVSGWLPFAQYGVATFPMSVSGTPFVCTIGESMTIRKWQQAIYVAGTNDVSNYWSINITNSAGTTVIAAWTTNGYGSNVWAVYSNSYSQAITASDKILAISATKVGSPGNLYLGGPMVYAE